MTQEEVLEYNKRCAEFLKLEISENKECFKMPNKNGWIILDVFHSDWNWIMKIVRAVKQEIGNPTSITSACFNGDINKALMTANEDLVVQAINQFLIWYNENKTN